jgi:hypothetical protein
LSSESGNSAAVGKPARKLKSSMLGLRFLIVGVVATPGWELLSRGDVDIVFSQANSIYFSLAHWLWRVSILALMLGSGDFEID